MEFKDRLALLIEERDINLSQLSKATGIAKTSLHNYLVGTEPSMSKLEKLGEFFCCSIDYLVTGKAITNSMDEFIKNEVFKGVFEVTVKKVKKK
ncbi:helix-turn-helix transcriptional regulator [Halobacteriovorax sp. JY17]|uniref:helix-turn-helix domain-containing protein n=1 Tax=Halobacteriovorax sp. JY17 TaxID=2014617 RepID=UPI000C59403E|nr:helix-turn-helix transcriptional regulator [Halobacteriovorax sp. JY17]PIK15100.1 MAG: hypothetical protein CES88_12260 [Halobacteriovorax sp. JY17]